ncbi:hypothetical protein wVul_0048 [Wolbachia endosymbiont of Armadillidium vulgare str. wVulC]|nr:hypothetical protein wVul_0048 [Wolbachia endosymbiont of Armadillidium vulgare str. wVulC]
MALSVPELLDKALKIREKNHIKVITLKKILTGLLLLKFQPNSN